MIFAGTVRLVLIGWLIEAHAIHRFVGVAASANTASIALLRSLGFRREGHFRESFWCNGRWLDDDYYALLASEWGKSPRGDRPIDANLALRLTGAMVESPNG